jgi:hypothetical protein
MKDLDVPEEEGKDVKGGIGDIKGEDIGIIHQK